MKSATWERCSCGGQADFTGTERFAGVIWTHLYKCPDCGKEFGVGIEERPEWPEEMAA